MGDDDLLPNGMGNVGAPSSSALNDLLGEMSSTTMTMPPKTAPIAGASLLDLLGDAPPPVAMTASVPMLAGGGFIAPAARSQTLAPMNSGIDILGGLGAPSKTGSTHVSLVSSPVIASKTISTTPMLGKVESWPEIVAYDQGGLKIVMKPEKDPQNAHVVKIQCRFENYGIGKTIENMSMQVAVPKTQKQQLLPPSSTLIAPGGSATQILRIANPSKAPIKLRLKIGYQIQGGPKVDKLAEVNHFPPTVC